MELRDGKILIWYHKSGEGKFSEQTQTLCATKSGGVIAKNEDGEKVFYLFQIANGVANHLKKAKSNKAEAKITTFSDNEKTKEKYVFVDDNDSKKTITKKKERRKSKLFGIFGKKQESKNQNDKDGRERL